jgi:hypothetical protein
MREEGSKQGEKEKKRCAGLSCREEAEKRGVAVIVHLPPLSPPV